MGKKKIACYCRVSTKNENQQSSVENQQNFFYSYIDKNPQYELYKLYTDEGISAKSIKKRKAFLQMVQDAKNGCFEKILVKDVSRLARNVVDLLETVRELRQHNVSVEFITYNMETLGNSEFTLTVLAAIAQEESHNTSVKVQFGKQMAARKGAVPSVVFGYDNPGGKTYTLEVNQREASVVRTIFDYYIEKQYGTLKIARLLNESCVPSKLREKNGWSSATVRRILMNSIYIGNICNGKSVTKDYLSGNVLMKDEKDWMVIHRPELAIVSDEVFKNAEKIRKSRSLKQSLQNMPKVRHSISHPLSNLIFCAEDGASFRRKYKTHTNNAYWICSKRNSSVVGQCSNKISVNEAMLHSFISEFLSKLIYDSEEIKKSFRKKAEAELKKKELDCQQKEGLVKEQKSLMRQRKKLMELFFSDSIDKKYLETEVNLIDKRLEDISHLLLLAENEKQRNQYLNKSILEFQKKLNDFPYDLIDNIFLKLVFERLIVYPDGKITAILKSSPYLESSEEIPFAKI